MESSAGMRLSVLRRSGVLAAVVLLSACGTPDEAPPAPPSAASASATSPVSDTSAGSRSGTAGSSTPAPPTTEPPTVTEPPTSDVVPSTVAPEPTVPASETPAPASQSPAEQAPPPAATVTAAPTAFPDPAEVEARGAATNPLCEVLSVDEVGALLGAPVAPAQDASSGTGCLWSGVTSDGSFLQLQMLGDPAKYVQPGGAEVLTGIGDAAFVVAVDGTWTAQAQNPDGTFAVQLGGPTANRDGAVAGLERLLERY